MIRSRLASLFLLLSLAPLAAQTGSPDGPYWSSTPLPAGLSGAPVLRGIVVAMRTNTDVWLWSAVTRTWTVVPTPSTSVLSVFNKYVTIEEAGQVIAWSALNPVPAALPHSPTARVVSGPVSSNWVTVVVDGTQVSGYSGFHGVWVPLTVSAPNPQAIATGYTALVDDGVNAYGFGAYEGTWAATPASASDTLSVASGVGLAVSPGTVRAFSSNRNAWTTLSITPATTALQEGFALFTEGALAHAFSCYTGTVVSTPISAAAVLSTSGNVAAIRDGNVVTCYAAATGAFVPLTLAAAPVDVRLNTELVLVTEPSTVWGFSGVTGAFAAPLAGAFTLTHNETIAFALGVPDSYAYAPIPNVWVRAPVQTFAGVTLVRDAAVIATTTGYHALSARYGTWVAQNSVQTPSYSGPASGAMFIATDGPTLLAYDARLNRWASTTTNAAITANAFHRRIYVGADGARGYGFGLMNNVWDTTPLQGAVVAVRAGSASGYVQTATHLFTYTPHGSLGDLSRFPEFSRMQARGTDLQLIQTGPVGAVVVRFLGLAPAFVPVGALGNLFLDPASPILSLGSPGAVPAGGILNTRIPLPNDPALNGVQLHFQDVLVPPLGTPWLSSSTTPVVI